MPDRPMDRERRDELLAKVVRDTVPLVIPCKWCWGSHGCDLPAGNHTVHVCSHCCTWTPLVPAVLTRQGTPVGHQRYIDCPHEGEEQPDEPICSGPMQEKVYRVSGFYMGSRLDISP